MIGHRLSHYQIVEKIGEGGMGVVYKAFDTHLDRFVALKTLSAERVSDPDRKKRFVREAKAASALSHPNIITIHDIDSASPDGTASPIDFIVMEYVEGRSLADVIAAGPVPVEDAVSYAIQIASAIGAGHAAGIIHRDIKPANVMVTPAGHIKVLDFGLAKLTEFVATDASAATLSTPVTLTQGCVMMGTAAYMSPEQAEGKPVDARTDVFSLGALLYEMLSGRRAFPGDSQVSVLTGILHRNPPPLRSLRPEVPPALQTAVNRCLEKERDRRFPAAADLERDLQRLRVQLASPGMLPVLRRPRVAIPAAALLLVLAAGGFWWWKKNSRQRWALTVALPEIERLVRAEKIDPAFRLGLEAERHIPGDPRLLRLKQDYATTVSIRSDPPGAEVAIRGYLEKDGAWITLGVAPIDRVSVPRGHMRYRIAKPGYEPLERDVVYTFGTGASLSFQLASPGSVQEGMVKVLAGTYAERSLPRATLEEYWLDRFEVTNRQFKRFVDQGGYDKRDLWKHQFSKDGKTLTWEQAMAEFRDATGRPGPSTWRLGTFPDSEEEFPVQGVSWYEAAAYAEFAGKSLPTIYHWYRGASNQAYADILLLSNFSGKGAVRVGSLGGVSPFGAFDVAGNVREWCRNSVSRSPGAHRYILGGAWNEPSYVFTSHMDAAAPFDRSGINGFRCMRSESPDPAAAGPIEITVRNYAKEKPAGDEVFAAYQRLYEYNKTPLESAVESVDDSSPNWRRERVTFKAPYGNERMAVHLFLPKHAVAPYQSVIYFPGAGALNARSIEDQSLERVDYLVRIGRAVVYPVYKGMYERRDPTQTRREQVVLWSKDFSRTLDYLLTRPDLDPQKLAFYGYSLGGIFGPVLTAIDGRVKASIQIGGGFPPEKLPAEVDPLNFVPRAKEPVLMIVGRHDFVRPIESYQAPMLRMLGAPAKDKRMVQVDSGHRLFPSEEMIKETLSFLDHYLGPVKTR